jgi:hypothetical protein
MHVSSHSSIHSIYSFFDFYCSYLVFFALRACMHTHMSCRCIFFFSFFFWAFFLLRWFFSLAISFVTFECYGIANTTLGLEQISSVNFSSYLQLASGHLFILRQAAFVAIYLLVNRMKCCLNRCRLGQSAMIL